MKKWIIGIYCLVLNLVVQAQTGDLQPLNRVYAVTHAFIVPKPGMLLTDATIVVRDGVIEAIGNQVSIPVDAQIIDADSMYVYAGFIDALSDAGIKKQEEEQGARGRGRAATPPDNSPLTNTKSGVTPEIEVASQLDPSASDLGAMRKLGFTTLNIVPEGRMIPGMSAAVELHGSQANEMILKANSGLYTQFRGAENRKYPGTTIAVMSKWRDFYKNAEAAMHHETMYAEDPTGLPRPSYDAATQAMYPVIKKEVPVIFETPDILSMYRAMDVQKDLGFNIVLANVKEGYLFTDVIKSNQVPSILSLDLPKKIKKKKKGDAKKERGGMEKGDDRKEKPKMEKKDQPDDPETAQLKAKQKAEVEKREKQAATLTQAGIPFSFGSKGARNSEIKANLNRMIKAGLTEEQALASLTTEPAKLLKLDRQLGTLEKGKIANLLVSTGPYFDEKTEVRYVFVDGSKYEYESKPKPKPGSNDASAQKSALGTWEYTIDVPNQSVEGKMIFSMDGREIKGEISNASSGDETKPLNNVTVSGTVMTFDMDYDMGGNSMNLQYELNLDGDNLDGQVMVGSFGTFKVKGKRISKPN